MAMYHEIVFKVIGQMFPSLINWVLEMLCMCLYFM